jgi:pilus assembly protein Flp/PilA
MMVRLFGRFYSERSGATSIEYGLIGMLISVAIIAGATAVGNNMTNTFDFLANKTHTDGTLGATDE